MIDTNGAELAAQLRMAASSEQMLLLTAAQIVIAVVGTAGLFLTIFFTRRSLELANATLTLQRESNQTQLRAYTSFDDLRVEVFDDVNILARFNIKNRGQTPAVRTQYSFNAKLISRAPGELRITFDALRPMIDIDPGHQIGGQDLIMGLSADTIAEVLQMDSGPQSRAVLVYGALRYYDVFGRKYEHTFAQTYCCPGFTNVAAIGGFTGKADLSAVPEPDPTNAVYTRTPD